MEIQSEELQNYISAVLRSINNGINQDFRLSGPIEFDLAVINTKEGGGGLKLYVAKAEGKLKKEEINRIKFNVQRNLRANSFIPSNTPKRSWV